MERLGRDFYGRDAVVVARALLGKVLVHVIEGVEYRGIISEVEAYAGVSDKACHTYGGRRTERTEIIWGEPGHAYIYLIYGMYNCLNVVVEEKGSPCAVLIRGVKPLGPMEQLSWLRYGRDYGVLKKVEIKNFTNGPGKVCKAFGLSKMQNGLDFLGTVLFITEGIEVQEKDVRVSKRINIDYAEEAKDYLYRFYLTDESLEEDLSWKMK